MKNINLIFYCSLFLMNSSVHAMLASKITPTSRIVAFALQKKIYKATALSEMHDTSQQFLTLTTKLKDSKETKHDEQCSPESIPFRAVLCDRPSQYRCKDCHRKNDKEGIVDDSILISQWRDLMS